MTGEETDPTAGDTELLTAGEFIPWELEPPSAPWFFLTERAADPGIRFHIQRGGLRATPDLPLDEPWARDLSSSLGELARLPVGWDTYGSPPPPLDLVWQVLRLLVFVERTDLPLPAVVPLPGGGIQLEWETASRELEVEFHPNGSARFLAADLRNDAATESDFPISDYETMRRLMGWLAPDCRPDFVGTLGR